MKKLFLLSFVALLFVACHRNPHFISDRIYRSEVHRDFESRVSQFPMLSCQLRFDTLCHAEREAMEFLYAYMPLSDLADYEPSFFLNQVRYAFKARKEMRWGKDVPEDVFRHFVLVYRVNNENLDTARMVMFRELKDRVGRMSIEEAALEVNHWCHEYVAYRGADSRTSSPLATMRTSLGRCGEESTFTVAALRAVGIPARQCYTPRWAHCDDNHAWVEVWVGNADGSNGGWKFLGACEPDPQLNMGWFSVPSTRCMMVHSKAFGRYNGEEEVVKRSSLYSELNLLSHYAPTRKVTVTVVDESGKPMQGAEVKFKLYNYAEYYTLSTQIADREGRASLTTGLGDLLVWATNGKCYAFDKIDVRKDSTMTLVISDKERLHHSVLSFEMVPPMEGTPKVVATEEEVAANAKRLAYEDSIRNAYTATFPTKDNYKTLLSQGWCWPSNLFSDDEIWEIVHKSEGNYAEIYKFFSMWKEPCQGLKHIYDYLKSYSDKDLRDITADVLLSHRGMFYDCHNDVGDSGGKPYSYAVYKQGIMPARVSNELVRPYRNELAVFKGMSVAEIKHWVEDSIAVDDSSNYFNCPISPVGVYKIRRSDSHSRDIFFVAACRAAGVPAYLDNATDMIYVWDNSAWQPCVFDNVSEQTILSGKLTLTYQGEKPTRPVYWSHFTLARLENGDLHTFDYENYLRMESFPVHLALEPGIYCLSTGNRYPDGAVRSHLEFFEVKHGERVTKDIVIMPLQSRVDEMGMVDPHLELFEGIELWDYAGDRGMLYINLGMYAEPSKHLVVELRQQQKEMKQWGGMTFMVCSAAVDMHAWHLVNTDLASEKGVIEKKILDAISKGNDVQYPLVVLVNKDGRVLYHSEGYKIGVIEQVLKATRR